MKAILKFVPCLAIATVALSSCSSNIKTQAALPIKPYSSSEISLEAPKTIRFQLPSDDWKIRSEDGITSLISPNGSRIVFMDKDAEESTPETRTGLVMDSYSETFSALGEDWNKAETQVISINKPFSSLPSTNIMWIANKAGMELAVLHFYREGRIFTIRVEGTENIARENLAALISGAEFQ